VQFDADIVNAFLKAFAEDAALPIPTRSYNPCDCHRGDGSASSVVSSIKLNVLSDTLMVSVSGVRGSSGLTSLPSRRPLGGGLWHMEQGAGSRSRKRKLVSSSDAMREHRAHVAAAATSAWCRWDATSSTSVWCYPSVQLAVEHHRAAGASSSPPATIPSSGTPQVRRPDGTFLDSVGARGYANWRRGIPCHEPITTRSRCGGGFDAISRPSSPPCSLAGSRCSGDPAPRVRVALDCVRGAGGAVMPELLRGSGAEWRR